MVTAALPGTGFQVFSINLLKKEVFTEIERGIRNPKKGVKIIHSLPSPKGNFYAFTNAGSGGSEDASPEGRLAIKRAGDPPKMVLEGTSLVTTDPAAITAPRPI